MANNNKKQTAKQKRILVASILLAGMIVAGGTFAWFTSKDEVTNKLTASNDYGVSITEDFTPPSDWTPGQVVNKDVSVVNTGNVDAFVKVSLSNTLDLTTIITSDETFDSENTASYILVTDEVTALQAGGRVVCIAGEATSDSDEIKDGTNFKATESGLYVFERDSNIDGTTRTYTYTGYYFDAANTKYYAVTGITGNKNDGFSAKLKTTSLNNGIVMVLDYSKVSTDNLIVATYDAGTVDTKDDIVVNINLVDGWDDNWSYDTEEKVFYYNNTVKAGETSGKLIDSLELDDSVSNEAYHSLEYNLKITADSVQVVTDESGKQTAEAVTAEWKLTPTLGYNDDKVTINSVDWSLNP